MRCGEDIYFKPRIEAKSFNIVEFSFHILDLYHMIKILYCLHVTIINNWCIVESSLMTSSGHVYPSMKKSLFMAVKRSLPS